MSLNIKIIIFLIPILFTQNVLLAETFQDNFVKKYVLSNGYLPDYPAKKKSTDTTSGKKLFKSRNLSLNGSVACADCHFSEASSADGLPIAVGITELTGIELIPLILTIMIAGSTAICTPLSYPTNLMVFGPGSYMYSDYIRLGLPITLIIGIITTIIIPLVFHL